MGPMSRTLAALAAFVLLVSLPVATWWLVGDLSAEIDDPDYMFRPPELTDGTERALGLVALVLVVGAVVALASAARRRQLGPRDVALAPLVAAGVSVEFAGRALTAGVGGANIGGGIILLFGPFLLIGLLICSVVLWVALGPRHR